MKKFILITFLTLIMIIPCHSYAQSHLFHTYDEVISWCKQRSYNYVDEKSVITGAFMISYFDPTNNSKTWFAFDNISKICIYFAYLSPNSDLELSRKTLSNMYQKVGYDEWLYKTTKSKVKITITQSEEAPSHFMIIFRTVPN